jgi:hypothetical protein
MAHTYRETIQEILRKIDDANRNINWLRDAGAPDEKKYFNAARTHMFKAMEQLSALDESLCESRADMEL